MKITVKADHLKPLSLLISSYNNDQLEYGLILEPSLTTGTLTKLSKIKSEIVTKDAPIQSTLDAIKSRNNITAETDTESDEFKAFLEEIKQFLNAPVELEFEPVGSNFIDNIVIAESKIPTYFIIHREYLSELLNIIKGEYVYPEELKITEAEVVE